MLFEPEVPAYMLDPPRRVDSDGAGAPDIRFPRGLTVTLIDGTTAATTGIGWTDQRGARNIQLHLPQYGIFASLESHLTPQSTLAIEKWRDERGAVLREVVS